MAQLQGLNGFLMYIYIYSIYVLPYRLGESGNYRGLLARLLRPDYWTASYKPVTAWSLEPETSDIGYWALWIISKKVGT